jgi:hypothetical protein
MGRDPATSTHVCSICHQPYDGFGHNADPFPGRCCNACNDIHVIPARIARMRKEKCADG